jgi:hypothetical protein
VQFVFGDGLSYVDRPDARSRWFTRAVAACEAIDPTFPRVTIHDLRHTAASLAVSAGANVTAVQRMLGHASAAMTLDTYADLFDDDLDAVSARLEAVRAHKPVGILPRAATKTPESRGSTGSQVAEDGGFELHRTDLHSVASRYLEALILRGSRPGWRANLHPGARRYLAASTRVSTRLPSAGR